MIVRSETLEAPPRILAVRTVLPPVRHTANEVERAFLDWLGVEDSERRVRGRRILRNASVDGRHSFLTMEEIFTPVPLEVSMSRYREHAVELGTRALAEALEAAAIAPRELDLLVTTSCTGYMIPSVDAYMAERLGLRSDLIRLPVTEMGCAAGASALMYASQMLRGTDSATAAVVNIEFPTNTLRLDDRSVGNIVATSLFSDGIGCTVLERGGGHRGPASIRDWRTHQVRGTTDILGYQLADDGFRMNLDESVPEVIASHFEDAATALLEPHGLSISDIRHFIVHPGGVRILDRIQEILEPHGGDITRSRSVMRRFGNMSSSTVTFILSSLLEDDPEPGPALMASFGPGFGAHLVLLDIHGTEVSA